MKHSYQLNCFYINDIPREKDSWPKTEMETLIAGSNVQGSLDFLKKQGLTPIIIQVIFSQCNFYHLTLDYITRLYYLAYNISMIVYFVYIQGY